MLRIGIIIFLLAVCFSCSYHGDMTADFAERTVAVNGKEYRYRVYLPKDRDPNKKTPVMLYLHGAGSRGDDNTAQVDGFGSVIGPVKDKIGFIVVIPQCRKNTFWATSEMANYALASLDAAILEFNGDRERIYLAGFSLGGYGTWQIAAANPGKFAALMPVAGGVVAERPIEPGDRAAIIPEVGTMLDSSDPYKAIATAIGRTPVWVFHGAKDDAVPVDFAHNIVAALREAGNRNLKYSEYENDGHMIFEKALKEPGFFDWLSEQRLNGGK